MKYWGLNLTKYVQDQYEKNNETQTADIKELNKWRDIPCSGIERINSVKMSVIANLICRCDKIPTRISGSYLLDIDKLILKFIWKGKRPKTANTVLNESNKVSGLTLPNFKAYYKATVIRQCSTDKRIDK